MNMESVRADTAADCDAPGCVRAEAALRDSRCDVRHDVKPMLNRMAEKAIVRYWIIYGRGIKGRVRRAFEPRSFMEIREG